MALLCQRHERLVLKILFKAEMFEYLLDKFCIKFSYVYPFEPVHKEVQLSVLL